MSSLRLFLTPGPSEHLIPGSTPDVVHFKESRPENSRLHIIQTTQKTETRGSKFKAHLGYIEIVSEVKEAEVTSYWCSSLSSYHKQREKKRRERGKEGREEEEKG